MGQVQIGHLYMQFRNGSSSMTNTSDELFADKNPLLWYKYTIVKMSQEIYPLAHTKVEENKHKYFELYSSSSFFLFSLPFAHA